MKRDERIIAKDICSKTFSFMDILVSFIWQCSGCLLNYKNEKNTSISFTLLTPLRSPLLAYWCHRENVQGDHYIL